MYKKSCVSAAAALLALTGVCLAQPPGITPEMITRALPLEGAPLAVPGPYEVTTGAAFGSPGLMIFHPKSLDAFPAKDTLPVLVWGNGGCAIDTTRYGGFHDRLARLPRARHGGAGRRAATAGDGRRSPRGRRLGRGREHTRRLAAERQDRDGQSRRHGPVLRRIPVD